MIQLMIDFLIQNSVWSIFTCSLVVGSALVIRNRPSVVHLLCVLTLIAMLIPPLFSIALPGGDWFADYRPASADSIESRLAVTERMHLQDSNLAVVEPASHFDANRESVPYDFQAFVPSQESIENQLTEPGASLNLQPMASNNAASNNDASLFGMFPRMPAPGSPSFLLMIWAIGSLIYLSFMARKVIRFKRLIKRTKPAREKLQAIVKAESVRNHLRRTPVVRELDANISPFVYLSASGPQVVMPSALADQLSDDEMRSLILHELVHLKRHDPLVRFLELIVTTIFWFNPALWVIRHQLHRSEELACDAVVADRLKSKPAVYAAAFLKTVNFLAPNNDQRPPSMVCTVGGYRLCRQRLEAMISGSNRVGVSRVQAIVTAAIALPILFAGFHAAPDSSGTKDNLVIAAPITTVADLGPNSTTYDEDQLQSLDLEVMKELTGVKKTPNIIFHYRPDDLDDEALARIVKINLENYSECEKLLKMKYEGVVHIFLYRNVNDLQRTTGTGAVAFSTGTVSVHQAFDFDSVHELTHIFALQFPSEEEAVSDMFVVEGLATTLPEVDEDIPIHTWAAVYQSKSRLPSLIQLRRSWPGGVLPGVHPYHVAGSFVGYLIEEFGIEKVKKWYVQSTEAHMEFGKTFPQLERDWQKWLQRREVEPEHRDHVLAKLGVIPDKFASAKETVLFDGTSTDGLQSEDMSKWKVKDGRLIGTDVNTWSFLYTERKFPENVGLRVKFRLVEGRAISAMLNRTSEEVKSHVNLATWATYISVKDGGFIGTESLKVKPGQWNEVVLVNDNGTARFYLNDLAIAEHEGIFELSKGELGIGVEGGIIEVEEMVALEFSPE